MKKILIFLLCALLIFSLPSCDETTSNTAPDAETATVNNSTITSEPEEESSPDTSAASPNTTTKAPTTTTKTPTTTTKAPTTTTKAPTTTTKAPTTTTKAPTTTTKAPTTTTKAPTTTTKAPVAQTVYITATGKKYHSTKNCSGLSNANAIYESTLSAAQNQGLGPCSKCH